MTTDDPVTRLYLGYALADGYDLANTLRYRNAIGRLLAAIGTSQELNVTADQCNKSGGNDCLTWGCGRVCFRGRNQCLNAVAFSYLKCFHVLLLENLDDQGVLVAADPYANQAHNVPLATRRTYTKTIKDITHKIKNCRVFTLARCIQTPPNLGSNPTFELILNMNLNDFLETLFRREPEFNRPLGLEACSPACDHFHDHFIWLATDELDCVLPGYPAQSFYLFANGSAHTWHGKASTPAKL
jgi:hypothetical protein